MSETIVQTVDQNALVDLFGNMGGNAPVANASPKFGMQEQSADLFSQPAPAAQASTPEEEAAKAKAEAEKAAADAEAAAKAAAGGKEGGDADILGTGTEPAKAAATGAQIADLATYYEDRIKNGKFVKIDYTDDKGNVVPFVPKTAEEYDEVLELQINFKLDEARKELEQKWYASKSPAWKAISQYAELVDDPTQLIPFLQGVRNIQSVANLDENDIAGAERIVRTRLAQNGDTEEIINQQIEALKTTDKLLSTAKHYKPVMIQQEQAKLQQEMKARQEQERQYVQLVTEIRDNALKSIEAPVFGKTKLKNEEKAAIYDLIAEPSEEHQGYGIYPAIDQLFEKRDFEKLKEIALLIANRDAFMNYLGTTVANATAASLERKLRVSTEGRSSSGNDFHEEQTQARVQRNQFKPKPSFGR